MKKNTKCKECGIDLGLLPVKNPARYVVLCTPCVNKFNAKSTKEQVAYLDSKLEDSKVYSD